MPPSKGPSDVAVFALSGIVVRVDPGTGFDDATTKMLDNDAIVFDSAAIAGDAGPYVDRLRAALDSPVAPVITKYPKA